MNTPDEPMVPMACTVNGTPIRALVPVRLSLVDWLRQHVGLTGSHVGCEHGACGACHIVLDGRVIRGCLTLAVQADGLPVETIDHPTPSAIVGALQQAFFERAALQCGYCTAGMILQAAELLADTLEPSRGLIRETLSGNICRCTGYHAIIDAVEMAAQRLRD
jgi:aerobic-type carbon monoxide dehydrogenase small subunit (CoxS/CutS family)